MYRLLLLYVVCVSLRKRAFVLKTKKCCPLRCSETVRRRKKTSFLSRATLFRGRVLVARATRAPRVGDFSLFAKELLSFCADLDVFLHARKEVFRRNRGIEKRRTTRRGNRARDDARVWVGWCRVTLRTIFRRGVSRVRVRARALDFSFFIEADRALGTMRRVVSRRASSRPSVALFGRGGRRRSFSRAMIARPRISVSSASFVVRGTFTYFCSSSSLVLHITQTRRLSKPRRPFEKVRLDAELKTVGEYGLRNKRELWRVQFALNKLRNAARVLLTLDEDDPKRIFEGNAHFKEKANDGLLEADKESLDYVLALTAEEFLERRLQTLVFKLGLAKSVHHARILIKQRHIRVGKQRQRKPSFLFMWRRKSTSTLR